MLDDTDFRLGEPGPMGKMRVKEADFSYKKQKEAPTTQNPKEKNKVIKKMQKMNK
jgi:HIV Tat-specific factor 1